MTVYGDAEAISHVGNIFTKHGAYPFKGEYVAPYADEAAAPTRTVTLFGKEVTLQYEETKSESGRILDLYYSTDEQYRYLVGSPQLVPCA